MIGLKRGTVILCKHEKEWETEARNTISVLRSILGPVIKDIQHVGSTSIPTIKAKPIIDIAIAVDNFEDILAYQSELQASRFFYRPNAQATIKDQLLFACGSYYDGTGDMQTHFIHVVLTNSMGWINYINFRNYLIQNPMVAKEYEDLKVSLAKTAPIDSGREKYLAGKHNFIVYTLRKALVNSYLGKTVTVKIDRPVGSVHPKHPDLIYPINYGYIPGVIGGDGEELDVYVLGVTEPVSEFTGKIIGIIHRENDIEGKLVAVPEGVVFNQAEIAEAVHFQEQYYITKVDCLRRKSCGAVVVRKEEGKNKYLLLLQKKSQTWSFPKGHMEVGETEIDTARREIFEEIGLSLDFIPNFRMTVEYPLTDLISKEVVLFLADINAEPVISKDEIDEYSFVTADEAKKLLYKQYGEIVDKIEKFFCMPKDIETYIQENLFGEYSETALKFVSFLRANNCEFIKDNGYWKDKIYYIIKSHDTCVCFISIKDPDEKENRWTVWSDNIDSAILDLSVVDDKLKEIAWNHVDHCGNCGSCGGGRHKIIFGKEYGDVCGCTFRFDNPNADDLRFLCKMVEIRCGNE